MRSGSGGKGGLPVPHGAREATWPSDAEERAREVRPTLRAGGQHPSL
jgi:hypothetical protein